MNRNVDLNRLAEQYRNEIIRKHKLVRAHPYAPLNKNKRSKNKKNKGNKVIDCPRDNEVWDYPTTVVSCKNEHKCANGHSCEARVNSYKEVLNQYLTSKLGKLGSKRKGCPYNIGHCAENHAANKLISRDKYFGGQENIQNIEFSKALITRTGETIPYCKNCTTAYNVKN